MLNVLIFAIFRVSVEANDSLKCACHWVILLLAVSCITQFIFAADDAVLYQNSKASLDERVNDLAGRLTQDEKLHLLTGTGFTTQPIPRLGIPAMGMVDAGQGVRGGD